MTLKKGFNQNRRMIQNDRIPNPFLLPLLLVFAIFVTSFAISVDRLGQLGGISHFFIHSILWAQLVGLVACIVRRSSSVLVQTIIILSCSTIGANTFQGWNFEVSSVFLSLGVLLGVEAVLFNVLNWASGSEGGLKSIFRSQTSIHQLMGMTMSVALVCMLTVRSSIDLETALILSSCFGIIGGVVAFNIWISLRLGSSSSIASALISLFLISAGLYQCSFEFHFWIGVTLFYAVAQFSLTWAIVTWKEIREPFYQAIEWLLLRFGATV